MIGESSRVKHILQAESAECGLACLAMIARFFGSNESLTELRRRFPVSLTGTSLKNLIAVSEAMGFVARPVRCDLEELSKLDLPCVLHWDLDHYVVLSRVSRKFIDILDPATGTRRLSFDEASRHFTGVALELTPSQAFERKKIVEKLRLEDLWGKIHGFTPFLFQIIALTLLLQFFSLLMPMANQMVIDDIVGHGDRELLTAVIVGFTGVAIIQAALDLLRNIIQLHAVQRLSLQLSGNLLRHLLKLPCEYFERRHVGDIQGRFSSLGPVQNFLTSGVASAVLDGIMVIPCGIIMALYSPVLAILVAVDVILSLTIQYVTFGRSRRLAEEVIVHSAKSQSIFLETIRAVRAIKIAGRENERHAIWQNATVDLQNQLYKQAIFNQWGGAGFNLLQAFQGLFMLYLGAIEIMSGKITLGVFFAFVSYAAQFSTRAKSLIGQVFSFRLLGLHLERLADIVHTDEEQNLISKRFSENGLAGAIYLQKLSFRYSSQDPWILKDIDISVSPGERIAFVGPSGGGKSTLLKLMTGLFSPVEGELIIDGQSIKSLGLRSFREQIGVVMQDDQLLSGTIADNISFFDALADMSRIEAVCRIACIHEEIMRLPMGYHSLIGDMGSILSGGQKQRVILARALYRRPAILFMDEGTANLDVSLEKSILENLKDIGITHIMVAHRAAAIEFADRVYRIENQSAIEEIPDELVFEVAE